MWKSKLTHTEKGYNLLSIDLVQKQANFLANRLGKKTKPWLRAKSIYVQTKEIKLSPDLGEKNNNKKIKGVVPQKTS